MACKNAVVRRKQGRHSPPQSEKKTRPLNVEELKSAEREIIEVVQIGSFPDQWSSLMETKKVKKSSHVIKLDPALIEGILCVGGRLQNPLLQDETNILHPKTTIYPNSSCTIIRLNHKLPIDPIKVADKSV